MDIDLDASRLVIFFSGFMLWAIVQQLLHTRSPTVPPGRRVILHAGIALLNTVTVRVLTYAPWLLWIVHVEEMGWGIGRWLGLYGWSEIILSIVVLDFFNYLWHRANHRIPFLWRFHKGHHTDNDLDLFTALRFHPGELLLSALVKATWIVIWGPSAIAWFLFEILVSFCAQMHHSNFDLPDNIERYLSRALVTPRFHATHHVVDRTFGDRNFSTIFSFWDPLFRTLAPHLTGSDIRKQTFGLPEGRDLTLSLPELLLEPVRRRNLNLSMEQMKLVNQ